MLFPRVVAWDNLLIAYTKAARGKRGRPATATFDHHLADNLLQLQQELASGTWRPGPYHHFIINEPKRRLISAAPFRDRVVHHALCNVIEPIFEARFHPHSYANRVGKGTHRAVDQLQVYARRHRYVLRLDIVQHFPSIDHLVLKRELFRQIGDRQVQTLINRILAGGANVLADTYTPVIFPGDTPADAHRERGLPIGNLTSQFWSNCLLNPLDWFITRTLGCRAYLRYVDDLALFADSKIQLAQWQTAIVAYLARLRLTIHADRAQAQPVTTGIPWLGFVVYPTHRLLKRGSGSGFRRRLNQRLAAYRRGNLSFAELDATVQGWINHVRYGDTWGLRRALLTGPF